MKQFLRIDKKLKYLKEHICLLPEAAIENYNKAFDIEYTHHSTAIEGNTLSLMETKVILEDKISIGGKNLREIYEVVNHQKAFNYLKKCIAQKEELDEAKVKDMHEILMENIMQGGIYRNLDVYISGSQHTPPPPNQAYIEIKYFFDKLKMLSHLHPIEKAAWTHAEFVKIHPFIDGNGRTSRLIMNYQLMFEGYYPITIRKEMRMEYFKVLEAYALNGELKPFTDFIAELEEQRIDFYISNIKE